MKYGLLVSDLYNMKIIRTTCLTNNADSRCYSLDYKTSRFDTGYINSSMDLSILDEEDYGYSYSWSQEICGSHR